MPAIITNKFRFYNAYQFMENFKDVPVQDSAADGDPNIGLSRSKFYLFVGKSTPWAGDLTTDDADGFLQPRLTMSQHAGTSAGTNYPFIPAAGLPGPAAEQYDYGIEDADPGSDTNPPTPYDTVSNEMQTWVQVLAAKNIGSADVSFVVPRYNWVSGETYAAYDDADTYLFEKPFYVLNRDYRVYKCIDNNGANPVYDEPSSVDVDSYTQTSDGYVWKFMYSISPADVVKFVTPEWIPVQTIYNYDEKAANTYQLDQSNVQLNAVDGDITRILSIAAGAVGNPAADQSYTITGDGNSVSAVQAGGQLDLTTAIEGDSTPFRGDVDTGVAGTRAVVSPRGGHGFDAVRELGGFYVMVNTRLEYDQSGNIFVDNDFRKIGLLSDPLKPSSDPALTGHTTYADSGESQDGGLITIIAGATQQVYTSAIVPAGYYPGVAVFTGSQAATNGSADIQVASDGTVVEASITVRDAGSGYSVDDVVTFALPASRADAAAEESASGIVDAGAYVVAAVLPVGTGDARLIPGDAFTDSIADQRAEIAFTTALDDDAWDLLELGVGGLVDFTITGAGGSARILNVTRPTGVQEDGQPVAGGTFYVAGVTGDISSGALTVDADGTDIPITVGTFTPAALLHDSGDILYVEHRRPIVRASDQIEDIKLIIEF